MVAKEMAKDWIAELAGRHQHGWSLEQPFYTDETIFQQDIEKIWMHYWVYVGHISQLPRAGAYITLQLGGEPVLIVRGEDGQVRAFLNVCRHRGSLICSEDSRAGEKAGLPIPSMGLRPGRHAASG